MQVIGTTSAAKKLTLTGKSLTDPFCLRACFGPPPSATAKSPERRQRGDCAQYSARSSRPAPDVLITVVPITVVPIKCLG